MYMRTVRTMSANQHHHQKRIRQISMLATMFYTIHFACTFRNSVNFSSDFSKEHATLYSTANEKNKFFAVPFTAAFKLHFALFRVHIQIAWVDSLRNAAFKLQKGKKCHI